MSSVEPKHTWALDHDSRLLRFYLWMWDASPRDITFCKLFWGYVLAPLGFVLWGILGVGWLVSRPLHPMFRRADERKRARLAAPPKPPAPPKEEFPSRVAFFFARPGVRLVFRAAGIGIVVIGGVAVLGLMAFALTRLILSAITWDWGTVLIFAAKVLAIALAVVAVASLAVWGGVKLLLHWKIPQRVKERHEQRRVDGKLGLGRLLVHGAKAVKSNTCPRIEVRS